MSLRCYITDSSELSDGALFGEAIDMISADRRAKAMSYCFEKDRNLSVVAGLFFRAVETHYGVAIAADGDGKPQTDDPEVNFNVSHSGSMVVCAVSDVPVGIDIETVGGNLDVSRNVMTPHEHDIFMEMGDRENIFCRMWTVKESYMKALGKGLSIPPDSFDVIREGGLRHDGFPNGLKVKELDPPEGYCVSVCSSNVDCGDLKAVSVRRLMDFVRSESKRTFCG